MPFMKLNYPEGDDYSEDDESVESTDPSQETLSNKDGDDDDYDESSSSNESSYYNGKVGLYKRSGSILEFFKERSENEHKLRIRDVRVELMENSPRLVAINYFNSKLGAKLLDSDILSCELGESWSNEREQDVVVSFRRLGVRYRIYNLRNRIKGALLKVCDELGYERIRIWKILYPTPGDTILYTSLGRVALYKNGRRYAFLHISDLASYWYSPNEYKFVEYYVAKKALIINSVQN